MPRISKAETAIIIGQAVMVTALLIGALLYEVYVPEWVWN